MVTPSRTVDRAFEKFKEALRIIGVDTADLTLKKLGRRYAVELQSTGSARVTCQLGNDAHPPLQMLLLLNVTTTVGKDSPMRRTAAIVTWGYAAAFGIPAIPVSVFLVEHGRLPELWGLFEIYGGPWSARHSDTTLVSLLLGFLAVTLVAAWSAWLLWGRRKIGAVLNLALLPVEAVFWIGFALPLPWLIGIARVAMVARAWRQLQWSKRRTSAA